jgi:hypothetical protein
MDRLLPWIQNTCVGLLVGAMAIGLLVGAMGVSILGSLLRGEVRSGLIGMAMTGVLLGAARWFLHRQAEDTRRVHDAVQTALASSPAPYALRAVEFQHDPANGWMLHDLRTHTDMPIEEGDVLLLAMPLCPKDAEEEI